MDEAADRSGETPIRGLEKTVKAGIAEICSGRRCNLCGDSRFDHRLFDSAKWQRGETSPRAIARKCCILQDGSIIVGDFEITEIDPQPLETDHGFARPKTETYH